MFNDMFCNNRNFHPQHSPRHFFQPGGRGRGGPGFGAFARGFMGGHHDRMHGGRKFSSADLQLVLLALLEARPAHGYELIKALEERSNGFYIPSPGVIYPALTYLEEIGHTAVEQEGNRKLYRLTDEGRKHLEANRTQAQAMLELLGRIGERMEQVREAFAGVDDIDPRAAGDLHRARHQLKAALMRSRGSKPEETRRIAAILERAAAEVLNIVQKKSGA